jgi:hypothetical protein
MWAPSLGSAPLGRLDWDTLGLVALTLAALSLFCGIVLVWIFIGITALSGLR